MNALEFYARNMHEWPGNDTTNVINSFKFDPCGTRITKAQWLAERARLQNKPSWDSHKWPSIAQCESGNWFGVRDGWNLKDHITKEWKGDQVSLLSEDGEFLSSGEILGDWRDTQEKRPECDAGKYKYHCAMNFTSGHPLGSVTVTPGWWDGEGLPVVGTMATCYRYANPVEIMYSSEKLVVVKSDFGDERALEPSDIHRIKTKDESAISEIENIIYDVWDQGDDEASTIAKAIYECWVKNQDAAE